MAPILRLAALVTLLALPLTACGGGRAAEEAAPAPVNAAPSFAELDDTVQHLARADNDADATNRINEVRAAGYSDLQIAEALGMASLRRPGKRVMLSVAYVHFRQGSSADHSALDEALEYGRTPPAVREAEAQAEIEEEEEEAEEEAPRRRRGIFSWIPGL